MLFWWSSTKENYLSDQILEGSVLKSNSVAGIYGDKSSCKSYEGRLKVFQNDNEFFIWTKRQLQLSVESVPGLLWFYSLHSVIGSERNSHYSLDQSDGKLKPIPTLLRVFPRFKQVACVYFEFPLVNEDVNPFYWLVVTTLVLALRSSIEICSTLQLNYFHAFRRIISILDSLWVPP